MFSRVCVLFCSRPVCMGLFNLLFAILRVPFPSTPLHTLPNGHGNPLSGLLFLAQVQYAFHCFPRLWLRDTLLWEPAVANGPFPGPSGPVCLEHPRPTNVLDKNYGT